MSSAAPDWYPDPERPGQLRYWDGSVWTDHRAPMPSAAPAARQRLLVSEPQAPADPRFPLVVGAVLGGAALLVALILVVVMWVDSYNTGKARGEQAGVSGARPASVGDYCSELAENTQLPGSADGYWDLPWVLGCKQGLG